MSNHPYEPTPQSEPPSPLDPASPAQATAPPHLPSPPIPALSPPVPAPPAPPMPPARRRVSGAAVVSAVIGAVLFFAAGFAVGFAIDRERSGSPSLFSDPLAQEDPKTPLDEARETCAPATSNVRIGDKGHTLIIDRAWADSGAGASSTQVLCIFDEIELPDYVFSQIEGTRALDGRQEADFGDYSAFWTYHPDNGLNMTITLHS